MSMRWQLCDTRDDTKISNSDVCMVWEVRSLMCTSLVAGNTQWLVSMGKLRKSKGMWGINAIARYDKDVVEVTVLCDDEWRCSWCRYQDDWDSSLSSRNTLGNGKTTNSKSRMSNGGSGNAVVVVEAQWDWGMEMMGCGVRNAEMEGKVVDYTRCGVESTVPK